MIQSRRTIILVGTIGLLVAVIGGLWFATTQSRIGPRAEQLSLRLKWTYSAGFAGAIVAQERGYVAAEGLDIRIEQGGPGIDPVTSVASGEDQFGIVGADRLLQARAAGIPLVAIALENRQSFAVFVALQQSGIRTPRDLPGKRVGVFKDDTYTVYRALLHATGIDPDTVEEVPVGFDLSPLLEGVVDVYSSYIVNQPPRLEAMNVAHTIIRPADYGVDFAGNVYIARRDFAEKNPEAVAGFVRALTRGWKFAEGDPEQALQEVMQFEPNLDEEFERAVLIAVLEELALDAEKPFAISQDDLVGTYNALRSQGLITTELDLDTAVWELGD